MRENPVVVNLAYQRLFIEDAAQSGYIEARAPWECTTSFACPTASGKETFRSLAEKWREERGASSSMEEIILCPSYLGIIALGEEKAVPLIMAELESEGDEPDHWFWALQILTGQNPVSEEDEGDLRRMSQIWRKWGRDNGYAW